MRKFFNSYNGSNPDLLTFGDWIFSVFIPEKHAQFLSKTSCDQPGNVSSQMLMTVCPDCLYFENAKYFLPEITTSNPYGE